MNPEVKTWFDSIAPTYRSRHDGTRVWHTAVFQLRTRLALQLAKPYGNILDFGAGTGLLYDNLPHHPQLNYYAYDISEAMLAQSRIPHHRRSTIWQPAHFPDQYDIVYMLGVSSYLSRSELEHTITRMHSVIKPAGRLVISFTHDAGIEACLRKLWRLPLSLLKLGTAGRQFTSQAYAPGDIAALFGSRWRVGQPVYFNVSLTPFQHLFPRLLAKFNNKPVRSPFWASDFILCMERL